MNGLLPAARIRAAIAREDWELATRLLDAHQRELVSALAKADLASETLAPWRGLLLAQRALLGELQAARARAGRALDKLGQDQRAARAWLRELA